MKIGIYDPYFHILGGAERYVLSLALCFSSSDEIVFLGATDEKLKAAEIKFGINTSSFTSQPWLKNRIARYFFLKTLDLFIYVTDGSLFMSPARKNILIIQTPAHIPDQSLANTIKLSSWRKIVCYSQFMADQIRKKIKKNAHVLFVPLNNQTSLDKTKKNYILSVGRFFPHLHNKKQLEMVQFFKEMIQGGLKNTYLYLVGSVDPGAKEYLKQVKEEAAGLPIKILTTITFSQLQNLYGGAKVYWHAAGYGEDLVTHPEKAEHFGVVTLEAMSHGAIPVVFNGGGQPELIHDTYDGFVWETKESLKNITLKLLTNEKLRITIAKCAQEKSKQYTQAAFSSQFYEIFKK